MDGPEDTVEHAVEVCPAWAEHRRVLLKAIGGGDLSRPALVEAMVRGGLEVWEAVTSCEAVVLAKEVAEHERELLCFRFILPPLPEETPDASEVPRRSPATVGTGLRTVSSG